MAGKRTWFPRLVIACLLAAVPLPWVAGWASSSPLSWERVVQIAPGQTLSDLAERYYGRADRWPAIARANGIADPRRVAAHRRLTIPSLSRVPVAPARATPVPLALLPATGALIENFDILPRPASAGDPRRDPFLRPAVAAPVSAAAGFDPGLPAPPRLSFLPAPPAGPAPAAPAASVLLRYLGQMSLGRSPPLAVIEIARADASNVASFSPGAAVLAGYRLITLDETAAILSRRGGLPLHLRLDEPLALAP